MARLFCVAISIAGSEGEVMREKHLKAFITAKQDVHLNYHGAGAVENRNSHMQPDSGGRCYLLGRVG